MPETLFEDRGRRIVFCHYDKKYFLQEQFQRDDGTPDWSIDADVAHRPNNAEFCLLVAGTLARENKQLKERIAELEGEK